MKCPYTKTCKVITEYCCDDGVSTEEGFVCLKFLKLKLKGKIKTATARGKKYGKFGFTTSDDGQILAYKSILSILENKS